MINFQFKKAQFEEMPKADPSFYKRFHLAWVNFQENELEARLQTLPTRQKTKSPACARLSKRLIYNSFNLIS